MSVNTVLARAVAGDSDTHAKGSMASIASGRGRRRTEERDETARSDVLDLCGAGGGRCVGVRRERGVTLELGEQLMGRMRE
jgi:hypothetical protein